MTEAERDCKHGQLKRACQICDLEEELRRLQSENEALRNALKRHIRLYEVDDDAWDADGDVDRRLERLLKGEPYWLNGTYSDDMEPPQPPDSALIADDNFPLDVLRRERVAMRTLVEQVINAASIKECAHAIQACERWMEATPK